MFIQAMNFDRLVQSISDVHRQLQGQAVKAVNMGLTLRNWLIGAYISEYELRGEDRAAYGEALFPKLAKRLTDAGVANCNTRRFRAGTPTHCELQYPTQKLVAILLTLP